MNNKIDELFDVEVVEDTDDYVSIKCKLRSNQNISFFLHIETGEDSGEDGFTIVSDTPIKVNGCDIRYGGSPSVTFVGHNSDGE